MHQYSAIPEDEKTTVQRLVSKAVENSSYSKSSSAPFTTAPVLGTGMEFVANHRCACRINKPMGDDGYVVN